jgi:hypothetical protein
VKRSEAEILEHKRRAIRLFTKFDRNVETRFENGIYTAYYRFEDR